MDRIQRIHALHRILKAHKRPVSRQVLQQELECSRATLTRILAEMRDILGAPIVYDRTQQGYHYDPTSAAFELPGLWFNQSELLALLASVELLSSAQPGLFSRDITDTVQRLHKLLSVAGLNAQQVSQAVRIQPLRGRPAPHEVFQVLLQAILHGQQVELHYQRPGDPNPSPRPVHPWRLLRYRDAWYLVAWCDQAHDTRRFALDRIHKATPLATAARPVDATLLDQLLEESFGIFHGLPTATAQLAFTGPTAHYVAAEIWHPNQSGRWENGTYFLDVPYADPRELLLEVLRHIPHVQVLGPQDLHDAFALRVRQAAESLAGEKTP